MILEISVECNRNHEETVNICFFIVKLLLVCGININGINMHGYVQHHLSHYSQTTTTVSEIEKKVNSYACVTLYYCTSLLMFTPKSLLIYHFIF